MAVTIPCNTTRVISVDEYLEYIRANVDLRDVSSIAASAPELRALANDRELVVKELNKRVKELMVNTTVTSAQTIVVGRGSDFYVRTNFWPANSDISSSRAYQDQIAYNLAHDHNFTFLTVSYLGPGYETELYEYDYESVEGYVGEPVDLRFLEKTRFTTGMVMLYRANKDVHIQYAPEELTITLNLMISLPEVRHRDQFHFDLSKRTISSYPTGIQGTGRASFVSLAGHVGNGDTHQLLKDLAARHPDRRTRLTAFDSLARQLPERFAEIWETAARDSTPLVSNTARRKLDAR